jgi:CrcB protein
MGVLPSLTSARVRDIRVGLVIAAGGALGAGLRWSIAEEWKATDRGFPWPTFAVNAVGCLALGILMVLLDEAIRGRVLVRPFIAIGILGGFTTFSAFAVQARLLVGTDPLLAIAYLFSTPFVAVVAVAVGAYLTTGTLAIAARRSHRRQS